MHRETTHAQSLVPRRPQRLVRRYAVQLVQVQAAADQRADETAYRTAHGAADTGSSAQQPLRRLGATIFRTHFAGAARRYSRARRRRWRILGVVSVWHVSFS
jgi:hypothetical protein